MTSTADAGDAGIVTPEAVPLRLPAAGIGTRALAFGIDATILLSALLALLVLTALGGVGGLVPDWLVVTIALVGLFALLLAYPVAFETLMRGRTPGKAAMGLRVVTSAGAPVRFRHAAVRAALAQVELLGSVGGIAVIAALLTSPPRRLGDLAAGTVVLNERSLPAVRALSFSVPAGWEGYATGLDPTVLSQRGYVAVRTVLLRAVELPPAEREAACRTLADPLAAAMNHRPPAGVTAELFLVCLLARHQQRQAPAGGWTPPPQPAPAPAPPAPASAAPGAPDGFAPPG